MSVKTCLQWLDHGQRRLCVRIAEVFLRNCGPDSITLDPVIPNMTDTPPHRMEEIRGEMEPALLRLRDSPGFLRRVQRLSEESFGVYPELTGLWFLNGACLYDISEPMSASRVQDVLQDSEPHFWAGMVRGILDLPQSGCIYLSLDSFPDIPRWPGMMVCWAKLEGGDLRFRMVAEVIDKKDKVQLVSQVLRLRGDELTVSEQRRVREVNAMVGISAEQALELCWEPINEEDFPFFNLCLSALYLIQNRIITTSSSQKRRKKGTRRKSGSGVSVTERTCKLDLDRWGRIVRRRKTGRSEPSRGTGTPRGPYRGPAKRVERYEREMWVREANVQDGEEWLDLKRAADGTCLVRVNRACNEAGYTIGCETEVNHTRATISFTESLTTIGDVNK